MGPKKWALRENFEDIVALLQDFRDEEINAHLEERSQRATYTSVKTVDRCLKCLSSQSENGSLTRLINAVDFSVLADESFDMADRTELRIFVRYVNSDIIVVQEFIGLTEVVGSKGVQHLCGIIKKVFDENGQDI